MPLRPFLPSQRANQRTERFILALIILNAITLGLETSSWVMDRIGPVLLAGGAMLIAKGVMQDKWLWVVLGG
jgi:voltage-gated sodium channel